MLDPTTIAAGQFWKFVLVLCRVGGLFMTAPILSYAAVPRRVKIGLAAMISIMLVGLNLGVVPPVPESVYTLTTLVVKETGIGLLMGFAASLVFMAIQSAGRFVDMQMGFAVVNILDPATRTQTSIIGQFQYVMAMLLYMSVPIGGGGLTGFHRLLAAIVTSFHWAPIGSATLSKALFDQGNALVSNFFLIAVQVAAPIAAVLLVTDIGFAVLSRAVPQLNIFIVGFPVKIFLGILTMLMCLFAFYHAVVYLFTNMERDLAILLRVISGGRAG